MGLVTTHLFVLLLFLFIYLCTAQPQNTLSYLPLDDRQVYLPALDDGLSAVIFTPDGIPFGSSHPDRAWIATNGILSFGEAYSHWEPEAFPGESTGVQNGLLIAPFWDDVDISGGDGGTVSYQIFSSDNNDALTVANLNSVNSYINSVHGEGDFIGTWMLVAHWDHVSPYPHGTFQSVFIYPDIFETNTFQAILITDHTSKSYTIFTFYCGDLNWARGPTIGYNAASNYYANHPSTGADDADTIDCINGPNTYYNVWYKISVEGFVTPPPPPPIEPAQTSYLPWLEHTGVNAGELEACDDCSSGEIQLPVDVPFGNYYHSSIYINTNGIVSFGVEFPHFLSSLFPTESAVTYYDFAVAPYWTDNDARLNGRVSWEMYTTGDSPVTDDIMQTVNTFINENTNETDFVGNFVFIGFWEEMHPYPAGASNLQAQPYLNHNNTVQGLIITNGTKTYAVFTYKCESLDWAGNAVIGFNAGGDYYDNHPLAGQTISNLVACVHVAVESEWNNVIYDLVPNPESLTTEPTPIPPNFIGSCLDAGITECCVNELCHGEPQDCYCDVDCYFFADCCQDIEDICIFEPPPDTDYLILASQTTINHLNFDGSNFNIIHGPLSGGVLGIDFHFQSGKMYWTDVFADAIYVSDFSGDNVETLVNSQLAVPDDVAVDWINDKLYWVDSLWARIEVMDITVGGARERAEIIKLDGHTIPRGVAVDPNARLMFWSDWGEEPKIERASMDGTNRIAIVDSQLGEPYGVTIDYTSQRVYWTDNDEDRIEFSDYSGGGRTVLVSAADGVIDPFAVTIFGDLLYWTDWAESAVYGTHKVHGTHPLGGVMEVVEVYTELLVTPNGIEAVSESRQPSGNSSCAGNSCEHLCLLSTNDQGYSCVCPLNYILNDDGQTCSEDPNPTIPPLNNGTCTAAGYMSCCEVGFCSGYPAGCFCDADCYLRGDCCHDTITTCPPILGSCINAGYDTCCTDGDCAGVPIEANCFCDSMCLIFDDCCEDFQEICPDGFPTVEPTLVPPAAYLPYLNLNDTGVESSFLPQLDDGISEQIDILEGLPFGNGHPIAVWIDNNGIFSFNEAYSHWSPEIFPGTTSSVQNGYLVTPFWDDVDIGGLDGGSIYYQVHIASGGNPASVQLINQVNDFIQTVRDDNFTGVWMLVTMWDHVHPFPHGVNTDPAFFPDVNEVNTYQAIIITDHISQAYTIFTYKCGDLNWARSPTIGFNAASLFYENFALSGSTNAHILDCINSPTSNYFNIVYNISAENFVIPPPLPTSEPPQESYLEWLASTGINGSEIEPCDDCSSDEITLPIPFPFGNYYHNSIYMSTNGIVSFGVEFPHFLSSLFPTESAVTYYDFAVAPYWTDNDARLNGHVSWEMYTIGDSSVTDDTIQTVNAFINKNTNETDFVGNFVFVGNWSEMHPYPAGASDFQALPYLNYNNTYQVVLTTDGAQKSYAIITFRCGSINWAGEAIIGYNAGGDYYENHPLSGLTLSNAIDCVHLNDSVWNNVVYNLVPDPTKLTTDPIPAPAPTVGTCEAAGFDTCCVPEFSESCAGLPQDCYCDTDCFLFGDCCRDIDQFCTFAPPEGDYLLFASHSTINHIDLNGENFNVFIGQLSGGALGINYHYSQGYMYWTDYLEDAIYRANLTTGVDREAVVNTHLPEPEDIAVDWVSNKLYWIDSLWARIEVMDISSGQRAELIRTNNHSIPRGIALDPLVRYIFWTDWGEPALIERASMDGRARITLHSVGINEPFGITCDYETRRVYWCDSGLDRIEYSFYDGSQRTVLVSASDGVEIPFALTIYNDLLYWTDWQENAIYGTHKIHGTDPIGNFSDVIVIYEGLPINPNGIEAITASRQPAGDDLCELHNCDHFCVLSSVSGRSCMCQTGYILNDDLTTCSEDPNPTVEPTSNGSCVASGYTSCCEVGFCGGYPANCFCDANCHSRGDCCNDIEDICPQEVGSCVAAGYDMCCTDDICAGVPEEAECYCDPICLEYGDCCEDFEDICPTGTPTPTVIPPLSEGSCVEAGYAGCCEEVDCSGSDPFDCFCDQFCYFLGDCCSDIDLICPPPITNSSEYLLFASHYFIHRANLDGSSLSALLEVDTGGAIGIQFHRAQNKLFYSDYADNRIYSATLDTGDDIELLLDDSIEVPEDLAVDWVANNLYWTDSFWARIEVMDLDTRERAELIRTGNHSIPRAIVVDPMMRYMYWTDWGEEARIERAGMDGQGRTVLINTDLIWPNGLAIDYTTQMLYWADANLDKIEYSNVDGSGRTVLETGETGLLHPYALTIDGDLLYWTDWQNSSVFATHKTNGIGAGGDIVLLIGNLEYNPNGIEAIGPDKQPDGNNLCDGNDCTHLCLLSVVDSRGYSCACPLGYELDTNGKDCIMTATSTPAPEFGTCARAGYTECCETGYCAGYPANCFCDRDCHARGDCCSDTADICADYDSYLLFANHYFIRRCNLDGTNVINLVIRESGGASGIEFDLAQERMYYSDYITNQILVANLNGSGSTPLMEDELEVPESLALDWIGHNLYWTDSFWARIEVMDLNTTERAEVLMTGPNTVPRGIAVDPVNRLLYWTDWGSVAKVERASMDGQDRVALITTGLTSPYGLTVDYAEQKIYWVDAFLDKIEYANMDGTDRVTLTTLPPGFGLEVPFSLTLEGDYLYWTEWDKNALYSVHKTEGGNVTQLLSELILNPNGIQTVSASRRPYGENPCASNDCTHMCLLSSASTSGHTCACPLGTELDSDGTSCTEGTTIPHPEPGSCRLYADCCEAGYCAGYPPNCFCDHDCHSRGDCCRDVASLCPEFEGSCIDAGYTDCCTADLCLGEPDGANCYCDESCLFYEDCCSDFYDICRDASPTPNTTVTVTVPTMVSSTTASTSTATLQPSATPTPGGYLFQVQFVGLEDCTDWVSVGKTAKIVEITGIITNGIQNLCNCYDINIDYYEAVSLVCDEGGDKSTVIYYGSVSTNQALEYVKTWVKNTDKVYIFGTKLAINTDCPVRIEEIDNTKCASPSSQRHSGSNTAAVAAPVVIILTLVVVVVLVLVAGFLYIRRKHGKSYNFFRSRGHGDEGSNIINYDGNESVSITGSSAGAELTSMKSGALGFEEKKDLSAEPPTDNSSERNYQNPTYGISEFINIDRTDPWMLQNPVYETVEPSTADAGVDFPEKMIPSPEDFMPPDTQPLMFTTNTAAQNEATEHSTSDDILEKTVPTPDDFFAPDTQPLVATTTITQATTMTTGAGGKYEPAGLVPMDIESEPRCVTLPPKHKLATAEPFAADRDESDEV